MLTPSTKNNIQYHQLKTRNSPYSLNQQTNQQSHQFKAPYFNFDIHSRIVERAKKENLIQSDGPQTQEGPGKSSKVDHLGKASRIVEDLLKKHGLAKQKITKLKQEANKQSQKQCSFKPQNLNGEKFNFKGNIIQRNRIWLQQKKRKQIERKEEALVNDLQQCTFSPQISSRKVSQTYLKNKSKVLNTDRLTNKQSKISQFTPSPIKQKKDISITQFQTAKKQIKTRLFTLALRN